MREGYRVAVRRYAQTSDGPTCHACLVYATDLTRRPPYRRLRWDMLERLIERGVLVRMATTGGGEDYYRLTDAWREADRQEGAT